MLMRTEMFGVLRKLGLYGRAHDVLDTLIEVQQPGGKFLMSQQELAELLDMDPSLLSRTMKELVVRNIVLRPARGRFELHPLMAGYETEEQMETAINAALDAIAEGTLPAIGLPGKEKRRHLAAVS